MNNNDTFRVPAKKSLGQHFLTSDIVPGWMCDSAPVVSGSVVLEIGPGTGVLTAELLLRGAVVIAVETDARSITVLEDRFAAEIASGTLHIYEHDIRDGLPEDKRLTTGQYSVIANIPYYLTGQIFRTVLETEHQPHTAVLLVQKEIAERIVRDKKGSLLQIAVRLFGTPAYVRTVSAGHFSPPPRVQSAIIAIHNIGHHHIPASETSAFFRMLQTAFAHKRKYAVSNLAAVWARDVVARCMEEAGVDGHARAENVLLEQWIAIFTCLSPISDQK